MAGNGDEGKKKGRWSSLKSSVKSNLKGKKEAKPKEAKPKETRESIDQPSPEGENRPRPFYEQPHSTFHSKVDSSSQQYSDPRRSPIEPPSPERPNRSKRHYLMPKSLFHRKDSPAEIVSVPSLHHPKAQRHTPHVVQSMEEQALSESTPEEKNSAETSSTSGFSWNSHDEERAGLLK